jgi:phosphomannomutase
MKPLKIGITGVRGIVGESFTPELVVEFAQAVGTYMDGDESWYVATRALPARWSRLE